MFWKRNAPHPPPGASPPDQTAVAGAAPEAHFAEGGSESRDLDAAIDAFVGLMRAFGEHHHHEFFAAGAVRHRAERVRQAISEIGFNKGKEDFSVTASIGVAVLGPGDTGKSWLARADAALYEAKSAGRNRVVFAEDSGGAAPSLHPSRPPSQAPVRSLSSGSLRIPIKSG